MQEPLIFCAAPIIQVRDPRRSAAWLTAALGFGRSWVAEDGSYAVCGCGEAEIHFSRNDDPAILHVTANHIEALLRTNDLAGQSERFLSASEDFGHSPPELRSWGLEEFHCYGPDHELYRIAGPGSS
jgi:hypothetical protein